MTFDHRLEYDLVAGIAHELRVRGFDGADVAIQTGSGIAPPRLESTRVMHWDDLPVPRSSAPGHEGTLLHGKLGERTVLVLEGRLHLYEGHAPAEVIRPVRALGLLGVKNLILTNATGGVREDLVAGDVVRVTDHVNLMGVDPLSGPPDERFGERFVVTAGRSHDPELAKLADQAAAEAGIEMSTGVYAGVHGPSFETPAEVRRLRALGADVCGMSTVPEILAATQLGMRILVLSLVANAAGVVADGASAAEEVLEVGLQTGERLMRVVEGVVKRLEA